ncbi:efflux RND transporter permease subunit [Mucilaginibacter sp. HMF5004]|uniref:efflux RND transporter permease subunit n=1 Tax=Mucilaginibacter rivuli TaxID=2857527 RepID=UPI001C5DFEAF|nr:efflux RND transporter permease subunit [Mucilaginibacter rivuli]MBW4889632.1 efflux RND transporter permease subunit [Mucilaginibacter rivuli]
MAEQSNKANSLAAKRFLSGGLHSHYKKPLLGLLILILMGGVYSFMQLKTGLFPDITFPKIKVIADAGQQPVDKMMTTVTIPLENAIKRTEGLNLIRTNTSRGSVEINIFINWNTDIDKAMAQVQALTEQVKGDLLPNTQITVQKMNPSILPVMGFSLEGNRTPIELKKIAQFQVRPFLAAVPGVADIAITGGKTKEYQVIMQPAKLTALSITPSQISTAITQANILTSNGYINDHGRLYLNLTNNAIDNIDKLQNLVVLNSPKRTIFLKDVADIKITEQKEYVRINANGKDVPLIAVIKQPDANLIDVNKGVNDKIAELTKILPKDVRIIPYYKQADFVNDSVKSIEDVLWIGLVLAIIVVVIFLRSFRASVIVLITIPTTLALSLIALVVFNYTINIMTLGAIAAAIGLMIDDAVIVVEQIFRSHEDHPGEGMHHVVKRAMAYLFSSMLGSSLSTIVIFIPFVLMSGVAGAYFKVLAFTMIITLSMSFLVTWLLLPMLFIFIPLKRTEAKPHHVKDGWIKFFLKVPVISIVFIIGCIAIMVIVPGRLDSGFLPSMDEGAIVLDFKSPPGTTLEETDRMLRQVDDIVQHTPEVASYSRRLGTQMGFFITEPNTGDYLIQLKKKRGKTTDEVSDDIRKEIEGVLPQLQVDFGQVIGDMLGDLMASAQPIEIKVYGDDQAKLQDISTQAAELVTKVKGTADVFNGITIAGPEINVNPDVTKLAQLGMNPADFQFQLQSQLDGNIISTIVDKEQSVNIRLIYPKASQTSVQQFEGTSVFLPGGQVKTLSSLAKVTMQPGVAEIVRENQKMMGVITARLDNRDLGSTLKEIQSKLGTLSMPSGYHIEYGGDYAQQQQAFKELLIILITASILVFIVLLVLFRNFLAAAIIIFLAVLGAAGCFLALLITHTPLNVGSYTGIIMIIGIIAENAIFTYHQYDTGSYEWTSEQSIVHAIAARLRPKLMTATGAIIALLPLALGIGTGAQLHQPLAIAVIGGLIFALPLLLIVLPVLLKMIGKDKDREAEKKLALDADDI